jgi:hypothetical protein
VPPIRFGWWLSRAAVRSGHGVTELSWFLYLSFAPGRLSENELRETWLSQETTKLRVEFVESLHVSLAVLARISGPDMRDGRGQLDGVGGRAAMRDWRFTLMNWFTADLADHSPLF